MLVELKNGETLNGHLVTCDTWMNLTLREVVQTSPDGEKFFRLPEVYVKGNNVSVCFSLGGHGTDLPRTRR
jgi:U6 snRNA-associated Sm-like protein LSm4